MRLIFAMEVIFQINKNTSIYGAETAFMDIIISHIILTFMYENT